MKKFLVVILTFLLFIFLNIFIISIGVRKIITNNVNANIIKKTAIETVTNELSKNFDDDVIIEIINYLENSNDFDELLDSAIIYVVENSIYGKNNQLVIDEQKLDKLYKEITNIVINNYLNSKNLKINTLTDEQLNIIKETLLDDFSTSLSFTEEYKKIVNNIKDNIYQYTKPYVGIFNRLTNITFKIILLIGIILIIIISALLLKSIYKWFLSFSIAGLLSGILNAVILPFIIKLIFDTILKNYNLNFDLNLTSITSPAYFLIGISGALLIAYIFIFLIKKNNEV